MGKGKGRQCGGFGSKALRAAWTREWQARVQEEHCSDSKSFRHGHGYSIQKNETNNNNTNSNSNENRPKLQLTQLRGLLQEREFQDRILQQNVFKSSTSTIRSSAAKTRGSSHPTPGGIVNWNDDDRDHARDLSTSSLPSLSSLCLQALASVLQEYLNELGRDTLHHMLSLLPASTLATLSVLVASSSSSSSCDTTRSPNAKSAGRPTMLTRELAYCLAHHSHVTRMALWGPAEEDQDASTTSCTDELNVHESDQVSLQSENVGIFSLLPLSHDDSETEETAYWTTTRHYKQEDLATVVPDSWEEYCCSEDDDLQEPSGAPLVPSYRDAYRQRQHFGSSSTLRFELLERLELGRLPFLSVKTFQQICLKTVRLTHLGLLDCFHGASGPHVLMKLPQWLPFLRVLDVSYCEWITEALLRRFWECYQQESQSQGKDEKLSSLLSSNSGSCASRKKFWKMPVVRAVGCLTATDTFLLEMDFPNHFWRQRSSS